LRFGACGLTQAQAAELCGVDVRTVQRWERANAAPLVAQRLLRLRAGELGLIDPAWRDFRLVRGKLHYGADNIKTPSSDRIQ